MNEIQTIAPHKIQMLFTGFYPGIDSDEEKAEKNYATDCRFIHEWMQSNGYEYKLDRLQAYLKSIEKKVKPRTYNKRVFAIRNRFKFALEYSNLPVNETAWILVQLKKLKPMKVEVEPAEYLTPTELETLIASTTPRISVFIEFLSASGCRISEALGIEFNHITDAGEIQKILVYGKGGKPRTVRVQTELIDRIKAIYTGGDTLFYGLSRKYGSIAIRRASIRYLGKDISAHTLRHSFATNMIKKTGNMNAVSKYLGHANIGITAKLYDHNVLSDDDLFG